MSTKPGFKEGLFLTNDLGLDFFRKGYIENWTTSEGRLWVEWQGGLEVNPDVGSWLSDYEPYFVLPLDYLT